MNIARVWWDIWEGSDEMQREINRDPVEGGKAIFLSAFSWACERAPIRVIKSGTFVMQIEIH